MFLFAVLQHRSTCLSFLNWNSQYKQDRLKHFCNFANFNGIHLYGSILWVYVNRKTTNTLNGVRGPCRLDCEDGSRSNRLSTCCVETMISIVFCWFFCPNSVLLGIKIFDSKVVCQCTSGDARNSGWSSCARPGLQPRTHSDRTLSFPLLANTYIIGVDFGFPTKNFHCSSSFGTPIFRMRRQSSMTKRLNHKSKRLRK